MKTSKVYKEYFEDVREATEENLIIRRANQEVDLLNRINICLDKVCVEHHLLINLCRGELYKHSKIYFDYFPAGRDVSWWCLATAAQMSQFCKHSQLNQLVIAAQICQLGSC